ncbi:MAG: RCC1 domain-containing protein [Bdellovibrionales bacterium]
MKACQLVYFLLSLFFSTKIYAISIAPMPMKVVASNEHSCVLLDNKKVKCWGINGNGELGLGTTASQMGSLPNQIGDNLPYLNLGTDVLVEDIQAGNTFTCVLTTAKKVKCWGNSEGGALGSGSTVDVGRSLAQMGDGLPYLNFGATAPIAEMAIGVFQSCVIFEDQRIKCWGYNDYGQLGIGSLNNIGDAANEMGDALPYTNLGMNEKVIKVRIGYEHSCALLSSQRIKCWGRNQFGQLGLGDMVNRGSRITEMGDALPYVDLGAGALAKDVVVGYNTTCAVLTDDRVKCWGANQYGQLGIGNTEAKGTSPTHMGDNLLTTELGIGLNPQSIFSFAPGAFCSLFTNFTMKCWGWNRSGALGLGDENNRGDNTGEMGDNLPFVYLGQRTAVLNVSVGGAHVCALIKQIGRSPGVKCWGNNTRGQLGLGDALVRGTTADTMGEALPYLNFGTN